MKIKFMLKGNQWKCPRIVLICYSSSPTIFMTFQKKSAFRQCTQKKNYYAVSSHVLNHPRTVYCGWVIKKWMNKWQMYILHIWAIFVTCQKRSQNFPESTVLRNPSFQNELPELAECVDSIRNFCSLMLVGIIQRCFL